MRRALIAILTLAACPATALDLTIPNAAEVRQNSTPAGRIRLPDAPWSPGVQPNVAEGRVDRRILRVPTAQRTPVQLLAGPRETLTDLGYDEVFACADAACGGFDFRFQLDILGEPDMHVDLGDYLYVLMRAPDDDTQPHTVSLLASRSRSQGFVHITEVFEAAAPEFLPDDVAPEPAPAPVVDGLIAELRQSGHAVLSDLDFGSGSAELGAGPFASLAALTEWLADNPSARIVLVGHTDSVGSLEANTALSRERAASVARFLTTRLGADPGQISSSGVGYLAPVASNLAEQGRAANRRVEVVLLSLGE